MIILNEKEYIESFINDNKKQVDNMYYTLTLLARYYKTQMKSKPSEIYKKLEEFLIKQGEDTVTWQTSLDKIVKKSDKSLLEIEFVSITKGEIEVIKRIKNKRLEKLLFTMLSLAKFNNMASTSNNNWINREVKEIFKLANVRDNVKKQYLSISEIKDLGLIKFSKKVDNLNLCVKFIDDESEVELKIDDFRDLGFQYLAYLGDDYIKCECCKKIVPIKSKTNKPKYCDECARENQLKQQRESMKKLRNVK